LCCDFEPEQVQNDVESLLPKITLSHFSANDKEGFIFGHFQPVFTVQQKPGDILHTFPGSTLMEFCYAVPA